MVTVLVGESIAITQEGLTPATALARITNFFAMPAIPAPIRVSCAPETAILNQPSCMRRGNA